MMSANLLSVNYVSTKPNVMKKLITLIGIAFLVMSCATTVQVTEDNRSVNNFELNNGTVTWSQVFPMNDAEAVRAWFASNFTISKSAETRLIGETPKGGLPVNEVGLNRMSVIMILTHPCVVYFTTDFKEDRYRVVVNKIIWYPQVAVTTYGVSQGIGTMDLNEIAVKNGGFKSVFYNTSSKQLDTMLNYLFKARIDAPEDADNW